MAWLENKSSGRSCAYDGLCDEAFAAASFLIVADRRTGADHGQHATNHFTNVPIYFVCKASNDIFDVLTEVITWSMLCLVIFPLPTSWAADQTP
jgi:hypothetical protein